jgi:outer membrane protein assembly factor BamB
MFQHDPAHLGFSSSEVPAENETLWVFDIGATYSEGFGPAVEDGRVFVGSASYFWCINSSSGLMLWNYSKPLDPSTSPAVLNGRVIISGGQEDLFCLNVSDGNLLWKFTAESNIRSSPIIKNGRVFAGSSDNGLYCLNETTGELLWNAWTSSDTNSPAVDGDRVFTLLHGRLACLDATTGTQLWLSPQLDNLGRSSPVFYSNRVFIGTSGNNHTLYCFNSNSGELIWKYETEGWIEATPAVANGKVFIGDRGNTAIVYCLEAEDGSLVWKHTYEGHYGAEYSSPAIVDGKIVICMTRTLFVLNEIDGDVVWSYDPPIVGYDERRSPGFEGSAVAIAEGRIFAVTREGKLYCFGPMLYYTMTIDPEFVDNIGKPFAPEPYSCTFLFSNGTEKNASIPATFSAPLGTLSIVKVFWRDTEVLKQKTAMYIDINTIWRPQVQCKLPTDLKINLNSGTSLIGFKVEITGNAACNGLGLVDIPILLSYSVTKGETWNEITQVSTSAEGDYSAIWMPSATGNYLVNASWSGDFTYPSSITTINLAVTPFEEQNVFSVTSNSTLSAIVYDSTNREFSFTVTGPTGTNGFVNANIAKNIVGNAASMTISVDSNPTTYSVSSSEHSWLLYFTYPHSSHTVTISLNTGQSFLGLSFMDLVIIGIVVAVICVIAVFLVLRRKRVKKL